MIVFNSIEEVNLGPGITTILGNFDGVHKGHQQLIKEARNHGAKTLVITFEPHPMVFKGVRVKKIQSIEEKLAVLEQNGVDGVLIIPFTKEFASMDKEDFVREILVEQLQSSTVIVGYNYHFGKGGLGKSSDIPELGRKYGFSGIVVPAYKEDHRPISSSLIRNLITSGKIREVNRLLGHRYQVEGLVVHGEGVGRTIGFPTANLEIAGDKLLPKAGVYSIIGKIRGSEFQGFCNVGFQPTFKDRRKKMVVEANFFDFDEDIYGERIVVIFVDYLRPVRKFSSVESLVRELMLDKDQARKSIMEKVEI